MTRAKRRGLTAILIVMLLGGSALVAYALWPAEGSGSGRAAAVSAQTLTVTAATGAADLYPGFTAGDVFFTVSNPNPYPVNFTSFTAGTVTSSDTTNCPSSNVTVTSSGSINLSIPANASNAANSIADVVTMASAAPDGCQAKTFTITLTLSGTQTT